MKFLVFLLLAGSALPAQEPVAWSDPLVFSTFSIAAVDPFTGELGVAVTTRVPCVGNGVPWVRSGVGAVATQANTRTEYGNELLDALAKGETPADALRRLMAADSASASRPSAGRQWLHPRRDRRGRFFSRVGKARRFLGWFTVGVGGRRDGRSSVGGFGACGESRDGPSATSGRYGGAQVVHVPAPQYNPEHVRFIADHGDKRSRKNQNALVVVSWRSGLSHQWNKPRLFALSAVFLHVCSVYSAMKMNVPTVLTGVQLR